MQLTITPEVEALLKQELQSGRFREPNDVIATALLMLRDSTPQNLPDPTKRSLLNAARGQILFADDWDSPQTNKQIEELFESSAIFPEQPAS